MDEGRRRQYLAAMGIQGWVPRYPASGLTDASATASEAASATIQESGELGLESFSPPSRQPQLREQRPNTRDVGARPVADAGQEVSPGSGPSVTNMDWDNLQRAVTRCTACDLAQTRTQTVFGVGDRQADLMVIGEAPGADEDRQGEPFVGRAGQLLNAMLQAIGVRREQVFIANILKCRPPGNRDPGAGEVLQCEPFLLRQVELVRPRAILSVGRISAQNLLKTDTPVGKLRGRVVAFGERRIPLVVTYHPAYLLRSPEQKAKAWQDLQRVMELMRREPALI